MTKEEKDMIAKAIGEAVRSAVSCFGSQGAAGQEVAQAAHDAGNRAEQAARQHFSRFPTTGS